MPALPADIAAASRDVVTATWASAAIAGRYPSARDGSVTPADGYFDAVADAQAVTDARGALIGVERRRFAVVAQHLHWAPVSAGVPQVALVDAEQGVNGGHLVARLELDLEAETTSYEVFG